MCMKKEDDTKSIWLSLSGVDVEKSVNLIKTNGDRLFNVCFYDHFIKGIGHESLHSIIVNLEGWEVSKSYDYLFHGKGDWWLP